MADIKLVFTDVDGTLVTKEKVLTERTIKAVQALRKRGIIFAVTSGRPPKGMAMLTEPLAIDTRSQVSMAAFGPIPIFPKSRRGPCRATSRRKRSR